MRMATIRDSHNQPSWVKRVVVFAGVLVLLNLLIHWYWEINCGEEDRFRGLLPRLQEHSLTRTDIEKTMGRPVRVGTVADQDWLLISNEVEWGQFDERCSKVLEYDIFVGKYAPPIPILIEQCWIYGRIGLDEDDRVVAYLWAMH